MSDDTPALPPSPVKVDITVAAHTVVVEAVEPLDVVAAKALELFHATTDAARRIPLGFASGGVQAERAETAITTGHMPDWEPATAVGGQ